MDRSSLKRAVRVSMLTAAAILAGADMTAHPAPDMVATFRGTGSGLPNNTVRAIARTGDGYLWLATGAGLTRTDGVNFLVYDRFNTPSLGCNGILSLYLDENDLLWAGTDGCGLHIYNGRDLEPSAVNADLEDGRVRALAGDLQGRLWIGTERGLYCHDGERSTRYGLEAGFSDDLFTSLAIDGYGRLWAGTLRGGLAMADIAPDGDPPVVRLFGYDDGLTSMAILALMTSWDGSVWIGTMDGLFVIDKGSDRVSALDGFPSCPVTSLCPGPRGTVLAGTMTGGLISVSGTEIEMIDCGESMETAYLHALYAGESGSVWGGTESMGLVLLKTRKVSILTSADGLPAGGIFGVTEDEEGSIWAGTGSTGLVRVRDARVDTVPGGPDGMPGSMVRAILVNEAGRLWAGSLDGGLCVLKDPRSCPGRCETIRVTGLPSENVTSLHQSEPGEVWAGTDRGLARIRADEPDGGAEGLWLEGEWIRTLYRKEGRPLLAGTKNGIWKVTAEGCEAVSTGGEGPSPDVLSLLEDDEGNLWAGTAGSGLMMISEGRMSRWTTRDGLPGDFIYSIRSSGPLVFWISSEAGIFAVNRDSLLSYAAGSTPLITVTTLDESDGLPAGGCSGYCSPASWARPDGTILYPAGEGIAVVDPFSFSPASKPPAVRIESVIAGSNIFDPLEFTGGGAEGRRNLEISFTAIDDSAPEKCSFIYMLVGRDEDFRLVPPGGERRAVYEGLSPGTYRFIVRAAGNSGRWSRDAAEMSFSIPVPLHRSAGFLASASAATVLLSAGGVFWSRREKRKKARNKYSTIKIDEDRVEKTVSGLKMLMEDDKVYLDPDLTLKKLAGMLRIHNNQLSRIINERFGVSFNDFVNRFRIEEARIMLKDPALSRKNILEIGFMAGFYSKSTFNGAFRKFTGTTPSKYRKEKS